jgi:hypothetical protein
VGALYLVDRTTLVALQGDVQLQSVGGTAFEPVVGDRPLQVGDRVRTGADGYAAIVYFDGSSTSLEPQTEVVVQRFERDPVTGATAIIVQQPLGTTWTLAAATGHQFSGFLLASTAGRFFARGSQFTAEVAPEGTMWVTSNEGTVLGRTEGQDVDVPPGFTARLQPGQPPDAPVPAPRPAATLQVRVEGPVRALLTDARGRSVGYHPEAEPYVSQIPGARLTREDEAQVFTVPAPTDGYELTLRGLGGGDVTVAVGVLRGAAPSAPAAVALNGRITPNELLATGFLWKDGQVREARALAPTAGPPASSAVALLKNPPPALAVAPTSTPSAAIAAESPEPEPEILAGRATPLEPEAADVFSSLEAPVAPTRPEVVAPVMPERPSVVSRPAPAPVRPDNPPPVVRAPEREPASAGPPVVRGLTEPTDVPPTAAPPPTAQIIVVTAVPPPPTPVPPTAVPPPTPRPPPPTPTAVPTVPPPLPTPVPTSAPTRAAPPRVPAQQPQRPSIAPTATPVGGAPAR